MTRLRARAGLIAGCVAWPAITLALAGTASNDLPLVLAGRATADDALAALAALMGLVLLGWLAVATLATALAHVLPGGGRAARITRRLERAITPVAVRRLLAVSIAGALVTGAAPATAAAPAAGPPVAAASAVPGSDPLDPSWAASPPAAPVLTLPPVVPVSRQAELSLDPSWGAPGRARPGTYPVEDVVVRRGDTLWDIAARHLGPAATDGEIAQAWPQWFAANRALIGPDPDHLTPGQRLRPPAHLPGGTP